MNLVLLLRPLDAKVTTQVAVDPAYTIAELAETIDVALEHQTPIRLTLANGTTRVFVPADYRIIAVAVQDRLAAHLKRGSI